MKNAKKLGTFAFLVILGLPEMLISLADFDTFINKTFTFGRIFMDFQTINLKNLLTVLKFQF